MSGPCGGGPAAAVWRGAFPGLAWRGPAATPDAGGWRRRQHGSATVTRVCRRTGVGRCFGGPALRSAAAASPGPGGAARAGWGLCFILVLRRVLSPLGGPSLSLSTSIAHSLPLSLSLYALSPPLTPCCEDSCRIQGEALFSSGRKRCGNSDGTLLGGGGGLWKLLPWRGHGPGRPAGMRRGPFLGAWPAPRAAGGEPWVGLNLGTRTRLGSA